MSVLIELHYNEFNMSNIKFLYMTIQLLGQLCLPTAGHCLGKLQKQIN